MRFNTGKMDGAYWLKSNGNYIAAGGRDLLIFSADGQMVMHRKDFHQIDAMAFLPDETLLVGDSKRYERVSLTSGVPVWSIPRYKRDYSHSHFALSPTFEFAYSIDMRRDTPYAIKINLANGKTSAYQIKKIMRATKDFMCNSDGKLCLLQCHYNKCDDKTTGETCILCADLERDEAFPQFSVEYEMSFDGVRLGHCFLSNTETILMNDLQVYSVLTETSYFAAENSPDVHLPARAPALCFPDASGRFLQMNYLDEMRTVLIDLQERAVAAQYGMPERLPGCLIGNNFWLCENNGIICKPFPIWEALPKRKLTPML